MFAFAGLVELPIDDWMHEPYDIKLRTVAVADVKEVVHIPDDYVYPVRTAKPHDCWLVTNTAKYYVALSYGAVCEILTSTAKEYLGIDCDRL